MKRETRIGLGVGLLFILGFGLILSEMANKTDPPAEAAPSNDTSENVASSRHVRQVDRPRGRIGGAIPPTQTRRDAVTQNNRPQQLRQQRDRSAEGANVILTATASRGEQERARQADREARQARYREMDAQQLQAYVQRSATPARPPRPATQTYVVQSGDTLTGIARRFMGDGSWPTVEKLYQMNRNVLSDPDMLSVGMRLTVPQPVRNN